MGLIVLGGMRRAFCGKRSSERARMERMLIEAHTVEIAARAAGISCQILVYRPDRRAVRIFANPQ